MRRFILLFLICILFLFGCGNSNGENDKDGVIDDMYAKELMINNSAKLIDVRTKEEYNEKHIEGALLLTLDDINADTAKDVIGDTDTYAIVYCRSGARSSEAKKKLTELGYSNIYDLGSINNWEE